MYSKLTVKNYRCGIKYYAHTVINDLGRELPVNPTSNTKLGKSSIMTLLVENRRKLTMSI